MPRTIANPTDDAMEGMIGEPVEVHVALGEDAALVTDGDKVTIHRGILLQSEGAFLIRDFGSFAVEHYREQQPWASIRRLESLELAPHEQERWWTFTPIDVLVYVQLEVSKPNVLHSPIF